MNNFNKIILFSFLIFPSIFIPGIFARENSRTIILKLRQKTDFPTRQEKLLSQVSPSLSEFTNIEVKPLGKQNLKKDKHQQIFSSMGIDRLTSFSVPANVNADDLLNYLIKNPAVEYAHFSHAFEIHDLPNDPLLAEQWLVEKIHLPEAWEINFGDHAIPVCIIDTGIDYFHEDLTANLWLNTGEDLNQNGKIDPADFNNIDDDENGFIDDIRGWDFTDALHFPDGGDYLIPDNDPADEHGHGTAVAGIISATANNELGIAGIAPGCKIMNLRAGTSQGLLEEEDVASAIIYAVDNGARIINMSFGDVATSQMFRDIMQFAYQCGVVLIASAGNSSSAEIHYPSGFQQVISVGATNSVDELASFSNFGTTIDLVAPGVDLKTTLRNNTYGNFSGTSASAPVISGVAALMLSQRPHLSNQDVRNILVSSADDLGETGWDNLFGAGRVNALKAQQIENESQATISSPSLDQGFYLSPVIIEGTASGALLENYTISYGFSANPLEWLPIITVTNQQVISDTLACWDIDELPDSSYTIRLQVFNKDGSATETSTRIFINRSAPELLFLAQQKMIDGYSHSELIEFETDDITQARLFYRATGTTETFEEIALEYEVKLHRYNFAESGDFEFYIQLQNKSGLITTENNGSNYYQINQSLPFLETNRFVRVDYELPSLYLLNKITDFDSDGNPEFIANPLSSVGAFGNLTLFEFENGEYISSEITPNIFIPRDIGDSDNDGLMEILAGSGPRSFLLESTHEGEVPRQIIWADSNGFWASRFADLDLDGKQEIIGRIDSDFLVLENSGNNEYNLAATLPNPTSGSNMPGVPHTEIGDFDDDGNMEILIGDYDGDIYIYEATGDNSFQISWQERLPQTDAINYISSGDYDGDGIKEFSAGCHSSSDLDLEHEYDGRYWTFRIYDATGNDEFHVVWEQSFFGFSEPADFSSSVSSGDLNLNGTDELLINIFPDFYSIEFDEIQSVYQIGGYLNPSRTHANLIGDINGDGKIEFLLNSGEETMIYQDRLSSIFSGPPAPAGFDIYPLNENEIYLHWLNVDSSDGYQIYRGAAQDNLSAMGIIFENEFLDTNVDSGAIYYYAVTTIDSSLSPIESLPTPVLSAKPGSRPWCSSAEFISPNQVRLQFNEAMDKSITNTAAYQITPDLGKPQSAILSRSGEEALLTLNEKNIPAGEYFIEVNGVQDLDRTPIDTSRNEITFTVSETSPSFHLLNGQFNEDGSIELNFNLPVDPASATEKTNYTLEPEITIDQIIHQSEKPNQVFLIPSPSQLTFLVGSNCVISVQNILSQTGIPIETGQGSQVSIIFQQTDLSRVLVFPNPCRSGEGQNILTFTNLMAYSTVKIISLNGIILRTIEDTNGNSQIEWDLKNVQGENIPAGIYLYYVSCDKHSKTGKFAIIK